MNIIRSRIEFYELDPTGHPLDKMHSYIAELSCVPITGERFSNTSSNISGEIFKIEHETTKMGLEQRTVHTLVIKCGVIRNED